MRVPTVMSIELTVALIALAGVLGSAVVSYIISAKKATIETQKLKTELQSAFGSKLYERRLETYPVLYAHISRLTKKVEANALTHDAIEACFEGFQEWDSAHAVFFGTRTGEIAYHLRSELRELASKSDEDLTARFSSEDNRKLLRNRLAELELALKHELGTFHFESPMTVREVSQFASYIEAQQSTIEAQQSTGCKRLSAS
jgi:hypothetical protein